MSVIITGCSRGIGFELVKQFLDKGEKVIALSRNIKPLVLAFADNEKLLAISFDVHNGNYNELKKTITNFTSQIDILINNAGKLVNKPFQEISHQDLHSSFGTNVYGPLFMVQNLNHLFAKNAHIINIGSIGGVQGSLKFAGLSAYSSAKGALAILTECLQEEFKETNWSFNCLSLGAVQTEMLNEAFPGYKAPISANQMAKFIVNFAFSSGSVIKGKVISVSSTNP